MKILLLVLVLLSLLMPVAVNKRLFPKLNGLQTKMLCAFMYILVGLGAILSLTGDIKYSLFLFCALISGFLGDFFLSWRNEKYFLLGVLFFGIGHIIYILTFILIGSGALKKKFFIPVIITAFLAVILILVIKLAKIKLKKEQKPLLLYGLILFFSFASGASRGLFALASDAIPFGLCLLAGSTLFIISDVFLAVGMLGIRLPKIFNHAVSYTYFPAQTLLALSIFFS